MAECLAKVTARQPVALEQQPKVGVRCTVQERIAQRVAERLRVIIMDVDQREHEIARRPGVVGHRCASQRQCTVLIALESRLRSRESASVPDRLSLTTTAHARPLPHTPVLIIRHPHPPSHACNRGGRVYTSSGGRAAGRERLLLPLSTRKLTPCLRSA